MRVYRRPRLRRNGGNDERRRQPNPLEAIASPGCPTSRLAAPHRISSAKHGSRLIAREYAELRLMRNGLAKGEYQSAQGRRDNAVAMVELAKAMRLIVTAATTVTPHFRPPKIQSFGRSRGNRSWSMRPMLVGCGTIASRTTAST